MTIKDMKIGESAIVTEVGGTGALRQHFLDMGVIPGTAVKVVKYAPMGDPVQLMIHGYDLTLRIADADKIEVTGATENEIESAESAAQGSAKFTTMSSIPVWARAAATTTLPQSIRCRKAHS